MEQRIADKRCDPACTEDDRKLLVRVVDRPELPILWNLNVGHATPRCIVPFGVEAVVDVNQQCIRFADRSARSALRHETEYGSLQQKTRR